MQAVDSEFTKNRSNEERRYIQIEKSWLAKQGSILNRFSTGNLETLKVPNIRDHLLEFYKNNYSSNLMTLALVGNHSLDTLQSFAQEKFSDIENKNFESIDYSNEDTFVHENGLGHFLYIVPQKDIRTLKVKWPCLKSFKHSWKSKPFRYITEVIGSESKNSLLSELIKQGLATSCNCLTFDRLQGEKGGMTVSISLTEKGLQEYKEILRLLFALIKKI